MKTKLKHVRFRDAVRIPGGPNEGSLNATPKMSIERDDVMVYIVGSGRDGKTFELQVPLSNVTGIESDLTPAESSESRSPGRPRKADGPPLPG